VLPGRNVVRVLHDVGRAVVGEGVVEARPPARLVGGLQQGDQERPGVPRRKSQLVEQDALFAEVGAQADEVALVGDHVDQLEVAEQAPDRVIVLAEFLATLDRDGEEAAVREAEAEEAVGEAVVGEVGQAIPDAGQRLEVVVGVVVARFVNGAVRAVGEVPDVAQTHGVAVDGDLRQHRVFDLPVALEAGRLEENHGAEHGSGPEREEGGISKGLRELHGKSDRLSSRAAAGRDSTPRSANRLSRPLPRRLVGKGIQSEIWNPRPAHYANFANFMESGKRARI
jgi:hypothetical protein